MVLQAGGTVPLVPSEPYAASARIVSAASAGGVLYLIGGRPIIVGSRGGAAGPNAALYAADGERTVGGEWRRIDLPVPTQAPGLRHATAVACTDATCWVAGWAKNPIVWEVSLADGSVGPTTAFIGDVAGADDPSALLTIVDGRPLVVTNASTPSAEVLCADGWSSVPSPAQATAIAALGSDAYVVAGDRLWRATVPAC